MSSLLKPYTPTEDMPWNLRRVVHLHRRAGFAATWSEIQRDVKDGPKTSIDRLLTGKARGQSVPEDFERVSPLLADSAIAAGDAGRLKAWWVYHLLFGPDPLGERLTLMWHNHFATSNAKVDDLATMRRQNDLFRTLGRKPFGELLTAVVRDPALLLWLDAPANRKEHPNENLGRELMELFTVGIGHYSEDDVKDAARALTGWTVVEGEFRDMPARHDDGDKTILGKKGTWHGDDLLKLLLDHPATPRRLAVRICEQFMGEGVIDAAGIDALADGLRRNNLRVGWAVETVLRSRAFFAEKNLGTRVVGPVEYVLGAVRALEMFDPPPSTVALADWTALLGMDLFYPPNVFGWPGGRRWINTRSVVGRANCAAALVGGNGAGRPEPLDALALARRHQRGRDLEDVIAFYGELLLGTPPSEAFRARLHKALGSKAALEPETVRRVVVLILASPEAQLG
ncbi:MAG TPA: DUF1800 domain-containing protein [Gemmataceae bacterium]|jgi:uncharacterized protein (DUF1800 family)